MRTGALAAPSAQMCLPLHRVPTWGNSDASVNTGPLQLWAVIKLRRTSSSVQLFVDSGTRWKSWLQHRVANTSAAKMQFRSSIERLHPYLRVWGHLRKRRNPNGSSRGKQGQVACWKKPLALGTSATKTRLNDPLILQFFPDCPQYYIIASYWSRLSKSKWQAKLTD